MGSASEQLRAYADLGDGNPDPALGLHNAKETKGGKPVDVGERLDALHPAQAEDTKVASTDTGERIDDAKAERAKKSAAKKTAAKKASAPKKQTADKAAAPKAAKKTAAKKAGK